MMLNHLAKGLRARITALPDGEIRSQFIRLGLVEGAEVRCMDRLPGGTIIVEFRRQEIALSGELAASIAIDQL